MLGLVPAKRARWFGLYRKPSQHGLLRTALDSSLIDQGIDLDRIETDELADAVKHDPALSDETSDEPRSHTQAGGDLVDGQQRGRASGLRVS